MAVVKATIKSDLLALYNLAKSSPMTEDVFADNMATIIRAAILSADVSVSVTSVSGVQTGAGVSGPGSGTGTVS